MSRRFRPLPLRSETLVRSPIPSTQCRVAEAPHAGIAACLRAVHVLQEVLGKQGEEAERLTGLIEQEPALDVADANSGLLRAQHAMTSSKEEVCALHAPCLAHRHCIAASPQHEKSTTMHSLDDPVGCDL